VGQVAEAPGIGRLEPGAVVEQPIEWDGKHAVQLTLVMDEGQDRVRQVGDERHDGEVRDRGVDRAARAEWDQAAGLDADLLHHLAPAGVPGGLSRLDPAAGQRDLPRVVPKVSPAPHKWHHPEPAMLVENEYDGSPPGTLSELAPGVDGREQVFEPSQEIRQIASLGACGSG